MKILNKKPVFNYESNTKYYLPAENVGQDRSLKGLSQDQILDGDEIHVAAPHSVRAKMRKNKREGDVEIISTSRNGFDYSYSSYTTYQSLKDGFKSQNKIVLWLYENQDSLKELETFGGEDIVRDRNSFGYWEMKPYLSFPFTSYKDASDINPPQTIRYANATTLEDDCAWFDGKSLNILLKGADIEFGVN